MRTGAPPVGRITRRPDYLAAAAGRRFHTGRLTAQGRLREAETAPDGSAGLRFGFTVTKRTGHATERNRIRRRLKAAVAAIGTDSADQPLDVVLIGRREALSAPFEVLVDDIRRALAAVTKPKPAGKPGGPRRGSAPPEREP
ncbi:ribonuclease P protein component [Methylobacterium nodulans]|uniref:Ribonuclease P protein component n=1 Tax=Methylobacterium nodulans (strain LMG 21967 / CNCM I-2342 / ORS 2060) TaxID=460265 RepID=B8IMM8_METNO|nr:ribonuclease P protein component [Methylobacterium nodulans]ACL60221.1 ribonuclease P protein [Methylobacterium nodulans ORS 2060]